MLFFLKKASHSLAVPCLQAWTLYNLFSPINIKLMDIKNFYNNINTRLFNNGKSSVVFLIIISILVFVIIILWIIFSIKNSKLKGKVLQDQPVKLDSITDSTKIINSDIPTCQVGREYSYTFWLYLEDFTQTTGTNPYKLIFFRGDSTSLKSANPIVFMDPISNKLYFAIKTQSSVIPDTDPVTQSQRNNTNNVVSSQLSRLITSNYFLNDKLSIDPNKTNPSPNTHIIVAVDYVPLQRWVNFAVVVDNKLITIYMDGQIYSVKGTDEVKSMRQPEYDTLNNNQQLNYNLIVDKTNGDVTLGPTSFNNTTINGYMSNLQFFNYSIGANDMNYVYRNGPFTKSFLSSFGINTQYGIRNPIYKLLDDIKK